MAKTKKLVYARDCKHAGEEISELVLKCRLKSIEEDFDWKTGVHTKQKLFGCHSQIDCELYKPKK